MPRRISATSRCETEPNIRLLLLRITSLNFGLTNAPPPLMDGCVCLRVQVANANAMAGVMEDRSAITPSFGVLMGDNFYNYGVSDVHSDRFQSTFEKVFNQPVSAAACAF